MRAPPSGVMVSLQLLPVSVAPRSWLLWLWSKETPSLWCVSPVASRPPAWSGGRMKVSVRITKWGQIWNVISGCSMWSIYLNIDLYVFQDLNSNPTKDWGSCQEAASCRSQVLRGQTQPLTPAQLPVHQASLPKSTACRFMVHESHHICDIWWSKSDDEEPLTNTKICWVTYPIQFDLIFSLQFVLPSNTARVSVMMLLWQKEVMLPSSVQLRAFQDQPSPGWKMGDLFLGSTVPRSWTREGCCRSKMLRCQTLGATPALLWTQQDRLTAGMTSVYTVRVMFS